jgi:hypothetical protein
MKAMEYLDVSTNSRREELFASREFFSSSFETEAGALLFHLRERNKKEFYMDRYITYNLKTHRNSGTADTNIDKEYPTLVS